MHVGLWLRNLNGRGNLYIIVVMVWIVFICSGQKIVEYGKHDNVHSEAMNCGDF